MMKDFVLNGIRTFREAAHGMYRIQTEEVRRMRDEIMGQRAGDAEMLYRDRMKVAGDVRRSMYRYTFANG